MKKRNILVTGGAGYIGSHMVLMLIEAGYQPIVVDNLDTGFIIPSDNVPFHQFDIGDAQKWSTFFSMHKIDLVMHFAASTDVGEAIQNPQKYYQNNHAKFIVLLNQLAKNNIRHLIFSSTAAIFGEPRYIPIDESHPKSPINPYGHSKLMCENELEYFENKFGIQSVSLRYFNASGADPLLRTGFKKVSNTQLIPVLLNVAAGKKKAFFLNGQDYETHDGTCVRDFIHVMDICNAHLAAMTYLFSGGHSNQFNLGHGAGYSILDVIKVISEVTGKKLNVIKNARRLGDPSIVIADSTKAKNELNWAAKHSDLNQIINDAWRWMQKTNLLHHQNSFP